MGWQDGFDHGAGHPLLFLDDANAPNCQKNNGFSDLGNYAAWPKVAGAVIQALFLLVVYVNAWQKHTAIHRLSNSKFGFQALL